MFYNQLYKHLLNLHEFLIQNREKIINIFSKCWQVPAENEN